MVRLQFHVWISGNARNRNENSCRKRKRVRLFTRCNHGHISSERDSSLLPVGYGQVKQGCALWQSIKAIDINFVVMNESMNRNNKLFIC